MQTLNQIEVSALNLPDQQRAKLALHLLESLPAVLQEDDEGVAEAIRRDAALEDDPSQGMTMDQFKKAMNR